MYSPITLDALRTLDAIDRRKSFAAAAEELFRVPSAISYTVSKLEEDLGVALFDRSKRKSELTPVGRLVLEQGRHILIATEELTALAKQAASGWEVELRICVDSLLESDVVYQLVENFQKLHPNTDIHLSEEVLGGTWDSLNADRCDLVIGAEGDAPSQGFGIHPLGEVQFDFVVNAEHPLTRLPQPIAQAALHEYPTVVVADSSRYLPVRSIGLLDGRSRVLVPSISRKIEAQLKGLGVGFIPRHRIAQQLADGSLVALQIEHARPAQSICAAWRSSNKGKGLRWFVNQLQQMTFDTEQGLHVVSTGQESTATDQDGLSAAE